jgi:general secretion pathway protein G
MWQPTPAPASRSDRTNRPISRAFTLVEVLIVVVILGILTAIAIPNLQRAVEKARIARAIGDVKAIGRNLQEYDLENNTFPASLSELGMGGLEDPWGNAYEYLRFDAGGTNGKGKGKGGGGGVGQARKDRFLVPINSEFDLYSKGPDGESTAPLTAAGSRDDIIWANDGGYVGIASAY